SPAVPVDSDPALAEAVRRIQRVEPEARRDRAGVADRLSHRFENLAREPGAVLERSPVLVRPSVELRDQERVRERRGMGHVDGDDVEPGIAGTYRRQTEGLDHPNGLG